MPSLLSVVMVGTFIYEAAPNGGSLSKAWRRIRTSSTCWDAMRMHLLPEETIAAKAGPMVEAQDACRG